MSFWRKKEADFEEMKQMIETQPGINVSQLARELNVPTSTITRRLPSLEEAGFLLYEDEDGRLFPFRKQK